jgi:hypothetical protein
MDRYRVMTTKAVQVAVDGGYCDADKEVRATNLTPTRMVFRIATGAQLLADDFDSRTIHVYVPLSGQVSVGVDLPRNCFIRV